MLVLSEEREGTLKEKATRFGLEGQVHLLMRYQLGDVTWREAVEEARAYCREHGLGVLVVDTFAAWAGLKGDEETKSGPVLEALQPLNEAAGDGLAVLLVAHQRKAAGAYGEAVRGSNALAGGVDVVVELERPPSDAQAEGKARVLHAVSRYSGTPDELACVLDEDGYQACGDVGSLREDGERVRLRQVLRGEGEGTVAELADGAELTAATARRRLDDMATAGEVEREGTGKRGDPYRFRPRLLIAPPPTPKVVQSIESDVEDAYRSPGGERDVTDVTDVTLSRGTENGRPGAAVEEGVAEQRSESSDNGRLATLEEEAEVARARAKLAVLDGGAS